MNRVILKDFMIYDTEGWLTFDHAKSMTEESKRSLSTSNGLRRQVSQTDIDRSRDPRTIKSLFILVNNNLWLKNTDQTID